jgi:magnesium-transporting ATPase (P-type)
MALGIENRMPGGDDQPHLYSGTLAIGGHGIAEIQFTGGATQIGDIGKSLASIKSDDTIIQKSVTRLVRVNGAQGLTISRLFAKGHLSFWVIAGMGALAIWAAIVFPVLRGMLKFDVRLGPTAPSQSSRVSLRFCFSTC